MLRHFKGISEVAISDFKHILVGLGHSCANVTDYCVLYRRISLVIGLVNFIAENVSADVKSRATRACCSQDITKIEKIHVDVLKYLISASFLSAFR